MTGDSHRPALRPRPARCRGAVCGLRLAPLARQAAAPPRCSARAACGHGGARRRAAGGLGPSQRRPAGRAWHRRPGDAHPAGPDRGEGGRRGSAGQALARCFGRPRAHRRPRPGRIGRPPARSPWPPADRWARPVGRPGRIGVGRLGPHPPRGLALPALHRAFHSDARSERDLQGARPQQLAARQVAGQPDASPLRRPPGGGPKRSCYTAPALPGEP